MFIEKIKNNKGFTFLELIIVVAILGTISAVGMSSTGQYVDESKIVKAQSEVATVEIALNQYNLDYPTAQMTTINQNNFNILVSKGYLQKTPTLFGTESCAWNYGTISGSSQNHITLTSCSFAKGKTISVY